MQRRVHSNCLNVKERGGSAPLAEAGRLPFTAP